MEWGFIFKLSYLTLYGIWPTLQFTSGNLVVLEWQNNLIHTDIGKCQFCINELISMLRHRKMSVLHQKVV